MITKRNLRWINPEAHQKQLEESIRHQQEEQLYEIDLELSKEELILKFIEAARTGNLEDVTRYLEYGANVHVLNDLALKHASRYGHLEVVKCLVEHGANTHADNDCVLQEASSYGHTKVVKYLKSLP